MGRYDNRHGLCDEWITSQYRRANRDPHIDEWWTNEHTDLVADCIATYQWVWLSEVGEYLASRIDDNTLSSWILTDEQFYVGDEDIDDLRRYRVMTHEPLARYASWLAKTNAMTTEIRPSRELTCPLCECLFEERSLPGNFVVRLGANQIDICSPCLKETLLESGAIDYGRTDMNPSQILDFCRSLVEVLGRIAPQRIGYNDPNCLLGLETDARVRFLNLLRDRPSASHIKASFGSWFKMLVQSGVLEGDAQEMSRGIRSVARDGHVCFSIGERTVDDLLSDLEIEHSREPHYPDSKMRGDFLIGNTIVEYLGLAGDRAYDEKTARKIALAEASGIDVYTVYPRDLGNLPKLGKNLKNLAEAGP